MFEFSEASPFLRKEGITISYLASEFREKMEQLSCNPDEPISQFEFQKLLLEPEIALVLSGEGVDVIALVDSLDLVYEDVGIWVLIFIYSKELVFILCTAGNHSICADDFRALPR